ncbi:MAG: phosphate ABC transporter permease subunit PstC [Intrasporangiaceae bacterium]|nr:phosphate ABC transporter permease subunit PstC [Intrasporangiaceae bacterium]
MSTTAQPPAPTAASPTADKPVVRPGDKIFAGLSTASGVMILVTLVGVAAFLLWQAWPALVADPSEVRGGNGLLWYIGPLVYGTLVAALIALIIAFPLSIGIALFISHYAPRKLAAALGYVIDLLAAVPSVVFGLWGVSVIGPMLMGIQAWSIDNLQFLPFIGGPASPKSMLVTGAVLAIMILPIMTAVNREVFLQTPRLHEEASLALGATRWEMIRQAVLPFGRSGIISGAMLGLGRALGETMAVAIILSISARYTPVVTSPANPGTIAADIALQFPEASHGAHLATLVASGLVLFFVTLIVNMAARYIVSRRAAFSGAN